MKKIVLVFTIALMGIQPNVDGMASSLLSTTCDVTYQAVNYKLDKMKQGDTLYLSYAFEIATAVVIENKPTHKVMHMWIVFNNGVHMSKILSYAEIRRKVKEAHRRYDD